MTKEYYKCLDCWRIYSKQQLCSGFYERCFCGSYRFKNSFVTRLNEIKRFLTDWKYYCFGEKAYEKRN